MSDITVVAKIRAKHDRIDEVKKVLLSLIEPTRKEYGCIKYILHQGNEDPSIFVFYEIWQDEKLLHNHMNTKHFKEVLFLLEDKTVEAEINFLNELQ